MGVYRNRAGHYCEQWDEQHGFTGDHTFIPTPICEVDIKIDDELCGLLANAQRLLGLLEGSCRYI